MSAPTRSRHADAVDRGVALLDAKLGRDVWLPRLNTDRLNVGSSVRCVACQATGSSWYGRAYRQLFDSLESSDDVVEFEGSPSRTEHYGFGILLDLDAVVDRRDFDGLTAEWRRRIAELRAEV